MLMRVYFLHVGSLFNLEQLVSSDHHPAHFEGAVVLIKSKIPLFSDGFVAASPHCMATTADPLQLGAPSGSLVSRTAGGPHLLVEPLVGGLYDCLLGIQT